VTSGALSSLRTIHCPSCIGYSLQPAARLCSNARVGHGKRILAIDYGSKNIGLACSDALGLTVQPLPSILNSGQRDLVRRMRELVQSMDIQEVVLGMPVNMDGTRGDAFLRMEQLLQLLRNRLEIPVTGIDERLSTVEALEYWNSMNSRRQKKYRTIDSLAAALILDRYLKEY
jgi:putative holliday junction resolvase